MSGDLGGESYSGPLTDILQGSFELVESSLLSTPGIPPHFSPLGRVSREGSAPSAGRECVEPGEGGCMVSSMMR